MTKQNGSLHGVRVVDMSRILAGPWATQMLGDLGFAFVPQSGGAGKFLAFRKAQ
jgi:hypothetical protein